MSNGLQKFEWNGDEVELVKGTVEAPEIVRYSEEAKAEKAYGEDIKKDNPKAGPDGKIPYSFTYDAYTDFKFVPPASLPKEKEQTKWVNDKSKMSARQKAYDDAMKDAGFEKPTLKTSEDMRVRQIANALVAGGWSEEDALAHARSMQRPKV